MIESEDQARAWVEALPECDSSMIARLERFEALLRDENDRQNLVSAKSLQHTWSRHFADSLQLLKDVPRETSGWLDLGTGAGFPGIAIAIARPDQETVCVESRALRTKFLDYIVDELELTQCRVLHCRLQDVETRPFGAISARAFAPLPKLLELSSRFSTRDTLWRLPKGRSAAQELENLRGWDHMFHVEQSLTDADSGIICGTLTGRKKGKRA